MDLRAAGTAPVDVGQDLRVDENGDGRDLTRLAQDAAVSTLTAAASFAGALTRAAHGVTHAASAVAGKATGAVLDVAVPPVAGAVVDRLDLKAIIDRALDELDLTQLVLDRVDLDAIVARADLEPVIDRLPLVDLADYVIEEIDLPAIIRSSTGGIARDALGNARLHSMAADALVGRLTDALFLKRRRDTASPLAEELGRDAQDGFVDGAVTRTT